MILDIAGNTPLSRLRRAVALSPFVRQRLKMLASKERAVDVERVSELLEGGAVNPAIDRIYPLDQVPDAMRHLESGKARGKVAIAI